MATWARAPRFVKCYRTNCGREIPRGELVCLVSTGHLPACPSCALKIFGYEPPAVELPPLPAPRPPVSSSGPQRLSFSDSVEPPPPPPSASGWSSIARKAKGELTRRQLRDANAVDSKLKAAGGDR